MLNPQDHSHASKALSPQCYQISLMISAAVNAKRGSNAVAKAAVVASNPKRWTKAPPGLR